MRPAASAARSGRSGDRPPAIRSALTKGITPASFGRYSLAKVVLPAPLGPAMMMQSGDLDGLATMCQGNTARLYHKGEAPSPSPSPSPKGRGKKVIAIPPLARRERVGVRGGARL